jgi:hypothetical protein
MRRPDRRLSAYLAFPLDDEVADVLGVTTAAVIAWRETRRLPSRELEAIPHEARWRDAHEVYGWDTGAATALGIHAAVYTLWRRRRGLAESSPPESKWHGERRDPHPTPEARREEQRRLRAYRATSNDAEAARRLRMPLPTYKSWRCVRGLPPKWRQFVPDDVDARRRAVYESTTGDLEASQVLGMTRPAFAAWRVRRGLPSKNPRSVALAA